MKRRTGPKTLLEAIQFFSNEENCFKTLLALRWPDGMVPCPTCGKTDHYFLATRRIWKCKACKRQFSIKVGTIFEDSPIKLSKWLPTIWLLCNCKNGASSYEVHRAIGVTQKTAWFMLHRIRLAMQEGSFEKFGGKDGPEVEIDETFIGGKARNQHYAKRHRVAPQWVSPTAGKEVVMGFLERGGKVRTIHVGDTKRKSLVPQVHANVLPDSLLYSDAHRSYISLAETFRHQFVDHAITYVEGKVHTNGLENFWSLLKRSIRGTYVSVEPFHLFRYLDEQAFRYNERTGKDADRFQMTLSQVVGRRVTYNELTGKLQKPEA